MMSQSCCRISGICLLLLIVNLSRAANAQPASASDSVPQVNDAELGETRNVHRCGDLFLAGQPTQEDLKLIKQRGIRSIITLREENEVDWEEIAVQTAGLQFVRVPFRGPETLSDDVFDQVRQLLAEADGPTLLHCGSANRVGAVWLVHRVLDQGVPVETAVAEARRVGLRNAGYEERAQRYIRRMQESSQIEESVRPGINENFLRADLNLEEWLGRFEVESREVFASRESVVQATGVQSGWRVADIGAGTGFFSRLFSSAVGATGWVYSVDISPRFLTHINQQSHDDGVMNLTSVLGSSRSINLPPDSIQMAFICDTYHHFEYPRSTLASIHRALEEQGTLIVIDFERIPGQTREFLLNHVRAGKQVFRGEIELAGFEFIAEERIDGFRENYFLRFRKK